MELAHNEEASLFLSCLLLEMLQKMNDHSHLSHILTSENSAQLVKIAVPVLIIKLLREGNSQDS